jgi:nudix-type nucleoside diphosphatase (YffH/AdpP family)
MLSEIRILKTEILSDNWYTLKKVTFESKKPDGSLLIQQREAYDRGNGAVILLYNVETKCVILTKQFRLPTYINGNETGGMIEACAGLLDEDNPMECILRETEEETGFKITHAQKIFEAYMSPGSVTELLHFFIASYIPSMKVSEGGGVAHEEENIDVLEMHIDEALQLVMNNEIKDAKTIILLQYLKLNQIL